MCYKIIVYLSYTTYTNNHINFAIIIIVHNLRKFSLYSYILCIVSKLLAVNGTNVHNI